MFQARSAAFIFVLCTSIQPSPFFDTGGRSGAQAEEHAKERSCSGPGVKAATLFIPNVCGQAGTVDEAADMGCFLREFDETEGELRSTDDAASCEERCRQHVAPHFRQPCRHWSWGAREGSRYYQRCFMTGRKARQVDDRRFSAGTCKGNTLPSMSNTVSSDASSAGTAAMDRDKKYCEAIMGSSESLRVWLEVEHRVRLPGDKIKDLHTYMKIQKMCTSDEAFPEALAGFEPPPPHTDTLYEKIFHIVFAIVDFVVKNIKVVGTLSAVLSPVLLPPLLGFLERKVPILFKIVHPLLPKDLKPKAPDTKKSGKDGAKSEEDKKDQTGQGGDKAKDKM